MKTSIVIATFVAVSAGAASAGALAEPNPYQGSDTLFNVTQQSLTSVGLNPADYIGGGSGNGQAAMASATPTQTTAPMSRMINSGGGACSFGGGTAGSADTNASSLVIALDAVDILASTATGASTACNSGPTADPTKGILNSGGSINATTWKDALALVYGGKDNQTKVVDCNQASRVALVSNWSNLFQNACANGSTTCNDANHSTGTGITAGTAPLWHAYRRDETSGTSDVFSSVLGLSPATSSSAIHGFGTSPYCNALNWDTTSNTAGGCITAGAGGSFNPHNQFIGPGGVPDPADATGKHRMPPPGINGLAVYGTNPAAALYKGATVAFDVLPTEMQDNDPIRRKCYGGKVTVLGKVGEDVCNIDGSLGLVLPLVDSDFIANIPDASNTSRNLLQYPPVAQKCSGAFINSAPPLLFSCAPANAKHQGECPNGDVPNGAQCVSPIATGFGQCNASSSTFSASFVRTAASSADGRAFNLFMTNGSLTDGAVAFVQQPIPALGITLDFAGAFNRIHSIDVGVTGATACDMVDMTDQIGCLGQADPCSVGYAGDGGKLWNTHKVAFGSSVTTLPAAAGIDAANVFGVYPQTSTVQLLGQAGEYPLSRKLYFGSLPGFSTVTSDELTLAKFESDTGSGTTPFNTIITNNDFFLLGAQAASVNGGGAANTTFCEDFNEQTVCNPTPANPSALPANVNGCATNPSGIPTANTVCGNGTKESYEECDNGTSNGTTGNTCSLTCRCTTYLDPATGACH